MLTGTDTAVLCCGLAAGLYALLVLCAIGLGKAAKRGDWQLHGDCGDNLDDLSKFDN